MYKVSLQLVIFICGSLVAQVAATALTLNGGQLTINGSVTATYFDFTINFKANVQWLAMIWSQNEADTDVTLLQANSNNPSNLVIQTDCYLDQNSYIQTDNVQNLMPSVTGLKGNLSTGLQSTFKRQLVTGDTQDITLYADSVIQVCFISANEPFQGKGYEIGNEKACTYISLHRNANQTYDRTLGSYASSSTFGGGNLTVYAVESTDGDDIGTWLFLAIVHKAQGLSAFAPRWISMFYNTSFTNADLAVVQYTTVGISLDIQIKDYFAVNASYAQLDESFKVNQGSQDLVTVLTAYNSSAYFVGSFKRKFMTGDVNRDQILADKDNTYCFMYGNALAFTNFTYSQQMCLNITITTQYDSNFRQTSSTSVIAQKYVAPASNVVVVTAAEAYLLLTLAYFLILW